MRTHRIYLRSNLNNQSDTRSPPTFRRRSIINPETILQNQIIVALCANGCYAVNHTVGQFYTKYGSIVRVGQHGEADIWGHRISDGRAIYIEVKLPGEHPRQDQQKFLDAMRNTGAISGCAHSVEEALSLIHESTV